MLDSPTTAVVHYPGIPMAKYGTIPAEAGGGNKYRIIWAPSRMVVLTGKDKTMTVSMYSGSYAIEPVGDYWILEGWRSCADLCGGPMTAKEWNANPVLLNTGPFPARGDYVRRETLAVNPSDANIEKLITWIEEGAKRSFGDNFYACRDNMDRSIMDRKNKRDALIRDSMRPYGAEPMVGYGGSRGTKNYPVIKSREELGLPAAGSTTALKSKKRLMYKLPSDVDIPMEMVK